MSKEKDKYIENLERNLFHANRTIAALLVKLGGETRISNSEWLTAPMNLDFREDRGTNETIARAF